MLMYELGQTGKGVNDLTTPTPPRGTPPGRTSPALAPARAPAARTADRGPGDPRAAPHPAHPCDPESHRSLRAEPGPAVRRNTRRTGRHECSVRVENRFQLVRQRRRTAETAGRIRRAAARAAPASKTPASAG